MIFKGEDVTLTVVSDGNEAFSRARAAKPDLILADVGMPGLGGYELCEKVRADAGMRHVPVLLLGGGVPVDPAKAIAVGANGHMPKPFDSGKLIEQVRALLANPKAKPTAAVAAPVAKPSAPPSRPPAPLAPASKPPSSVGAGSTMVMARPAVPPAARPAASTPPAARPVAPAASRPPAPVSKPAPPAARPPAAAPPPAARPPAAPAAS